MTEEGSALSSTFAMVYAAPPDRQRAYYRSLAEIFEARLEDSFLPGELRAVVDSLADAWGRSTGRPTRP